MLWWRRRGTVIGKSLRVLGKVTAEGLVKVYGQIEGELQCASLVVSREAEVRGAVTAEKVTIDGRVEGPVVASLVILKSHAQVIGDIHHESLAIGRGATFEGRSVRIHGSGGSETGRDDKKRSRKQDKLEPELMAEEPVLKAVVR